MMRLVENSASSNNIICGSFVEWYDWKAILSEYFTIPKDFKITEFHVFEFNQTNLEQFNFLVPRHKQHKFQVGGYSMFVALIK